MYTISRDISMLYANASWLFTRCDHGRFEGFVDINLIYNRHAYINMHQTSYKTTKMTMFKPWNLS